MLIRPLSRTLAAVACLAALGVSGRAASQPATPASTSAPGASSAAPAGPAQAALDKADELYRKGNAAVAAKDWPRAFEHFLNAFQLKKSYDIEGNLGAAELKLGKYRDAAEHLLHSLTLFPVNGKEENKRRTEELLADAKKEVGILKLTISPPFALVNVGGRALKPGEPPEQVFVEPGEMRIEVGGTSDYEPTSRSVKVAKGQVVDLAIALKLAAKSGPTASVSASGIASGVPTTGPAVSGPRKEIVIAGGVVAGASLIAGAVLFGVATGMQGDLQADAPKNPDGTLTCARDASTGTTIKACDDFRDRLRGNNALGQAGVGFIVAGGAVGLGTVLYALLAPSAPKSTGARVVPVATPSSAGLVMTGSF